jgi:hypothetical protein
MSGNIITNHVRKCCKQLNKKTIHMSVDTEFNLLIIVECVSYIHTWHVIWTTLSYIKIKGNATDMVTGIVWDSGTNIHTYSISIQCDNLSSWTEAMINHTKKRLIPSHKTISDCFCIMFTSPVQQIEYPRKHFFPYCLQFSLSQSAGSMKQSQKKSSGAKSGE